MDKDKSITLQKQVRDNADDLRKEFLDMKNWEDQMKKTEKKLQSSGDADDQEQLLPPVRTKKSSSRSKLKPKENGSKAKRIKSYDYSAWDRFDVDKACEEISKESESEDSGDEVLSKEELEKNHEEATKHKVMGNVFVQQQKWHEAMACYNEAIKIFPFDAVFYANRALCHLKMDNLYSAEADCTAAILRDEHYVKAYFRRATVRMALKEYKGVIQDLKHLLTLEPTNNEAKKMLATASKYLDKSKPVIITSKKIVEEEEKSIIESKKIEKSREDKAVEPSKEVEKVNKKEEDQKANMHGSVILPDWLPEHMVKKNVRIIEPITKLPHQRSKTPLKKIPITIRDIMAESTEIATGSSVPVADEPHKNTSTNISTEKIQKEEIIKTSTKNINEQNEESDIEIPPVPKTSIQFLLTWRKYKIPKFRYKYLKQLPAENIPKLFQDSMESETFSEIISTLNTQFVPQKDKVFDYLKYLSGIKRFSTLTMFMGKKEKEDLNGLFDFCQAVEGQSDVDIKEMRIKYEI